MPIRYSSHALERYQDRVRDCSTEQARLELAHLLEAGEVRPDRPPGISSETSEADAWCWLNHDGSIAAPLRLENNCLVAVSVLTRARMPDAMRKRHNRAKATRRAGRKAEKIAKRMDRGQTVRPGVTAAEWD